MPEKGGLQLLPETRKKIDIKVPGRKRFFSISLIIFVLVAAAFAASFYYKGVLEEELLMLDIQIENIDKSRDKVAEQQLITLEKQLSLMSDILNNHLFWSAGFDRLENLLKPEVRVDDISADLAKNSLQMKATAKDLITVARLISSFNSDDSIENVDLSDVNLLSDGTVSLNIRLIFDESKFLR